MLRQQKRGFDDTANDGVDRIEPNHHAGDRRISNEWERWSRNFGSASPIVWRETALVHRNLGVQTPQPLGGVWSDLGVLGVLGYSVPRYEA